MTKSKIKQAQDVHRALIEMYKAGFIDGYAYRKRDLKPKKLKKLMAEAFAKRFDLPVEKK